MRRAFAALAAVMMTAAAPSVGAERPRDDVGTIMGTAPKDATLEHWLAAERCVYLTFGNDPAFDPIGHVVPLSESEADGAHRFTLIDADMGFWDSGGGEPVFGPDADFDVTFYADLGTCGSDRPPAPGTPPQFLGPGNEEGMIPAGMRYAVITLANNPFSAFIFSVHSP